MPSYVHLDLVRSRTPTRTSPSHRQRINFAVPDKLKNQVYDYLATLSVGTPGQTVDVAVDTGSSDLWVYAKGSQAPESFDPSASSTYQFLSSDFSIQYVKGSANGNWVTDNVDFGSDSVQSLQFATVTTAPQDGETTGIFGIGQVTQETSAQQGQTYLNFPAALKAQGKIKANAYSLYLNSVSSSASSITFGGVDTGKYTGPLWTIPFTDTRAFYVDFEVAGSKGNGVLDSGTSLTYLDQSTVDAIAQQYGATFSSQEQAYILEGGQPASTDPLVYTFANGATISVPVSELFITEGNTTVMSIMANSNSQGVTLLGDSFLRSAYVVYNLDGNVGGIAQANWNPTTSNIVEITDGTIPGAQTSTALSS